VAIRFDPETTVWLESLSLRTIFLNEIMGTGISDTEPRDLLIQIAEDNDGQPGDLIIDSHYHQFQRPLGNLRQETISLHGYYQELSERKEPFFIILSNDSDDSNYFAIGMDSMHAISETHINDNMINASWQSLETTTIGLNPMSGWNAMCRVSVVPKTEYINNQFLSPAFSHDYSNVNLELSLPFPVDTLTSGVVARLPSGFLVDPTTNFQSSTITAAIPLEVGGSYSVSVHLVSDDQGKAIDTVFTWEVPVPGSFQLAQNYPNPFNTGTTVPYIILEPGDITVRIFDILGREQKQLIVDHVQSGVHELELDMTGFPSGVYLSRVEYRKQRDQRMEYDVVKLLLIK